MLSHHEQRCLAEIERQLQQDPTLTKLAEQLAVDDPGRRRRRGRIAWWVGLIMELGALSWVAVGVATGVQVDVVVGALFAVLLGIPVVGVATARLLDRRRGW